MGQKRYPDLTVNELREIIQSLFGAEHHTKGDHEFYKGIIRGIYRTAQIDCGRNPIFGKMIINVIKNVGLSREEFYGLSKSAARKINCKHLKDGLPATETGLAT